MGGNSQLAEMISGSYQHETSSPAPPRRKAVLRGPLRTFDNILKQISAGHLSLLCPDGTLLEYGDPDASLRARVYVNNPDFFPRVVSGASLALGETYVDGWWDVEGDRIHDFLALLLRNRLYEKVRESFPTLVRIAWERIRNAPTTIGKAKECVSFHYDLSNDFYSNFLDPTMAYSAGYQCQAGDSLEDMQRQKYDLICRKLGLDHGGRLLDIGCGWGGLLIHAAQHHKFLHGTGITLSESQYKLAESRIIENHLENRLEVKIQDYRETRGFYDFIVSVGMFEHVGLASYPEFFRQVSILMKPDAVGLLHTIGLTDDPAVKPDPWIQRYIFPGSRLPRLEEIVSEMQRNGLVPAHIENLKIHYAETLRHWKNNFERNYSRIRLLDRRFDTRFFRLWNYYLQTCEASFRHSSVQLYQILFCREDHWPFPRQMGVWE